MKKNTLLLFVALLLSATFIQAQDIINPVGVTMSLPNTLNTPPINIVNGEGLSEFPSITATHENNSQTNALLYINGSNTIDFDLGGNFDIEGFAIWNAIGPGSNNFGVKDVIISASQDGVNFTLIPGSPIELAESMSAPALPETFSFDAVNATHIRIVALNNHGEPSFTGISEVAFIGTSTSTDNIINPVSASTTLDAQFGSSLDNTINGSGLDIFPTLSGTHEATSPGNAFFATNDTGSIDFDLGGSYLVDGLAFWNANAPGPGQTGIQGVVISSSEDGVTYTPITGSPTSFAQVMSPTSAAEQFSFTEITASFIRFDVVSNYGDPGNLVAFAEVAFSGIAAPPVEENVINPVSATTTLAAQFGSSLDNTINGAGLDVFPTLSGTHEATSPGNAFFATNDTGSIYFDLGGSYLVDGLAFWNANAPGPGQTGIQGVVISSSEDGVTYTPIAEAPSTFAQVMSPTSTAEQFSFTEVTASFIRFDVVSNYGDPGNLVAFAEVAFSGIEIPPVENVINPVSASTTLAAQFGSSLDNTINGAGLDVFPTLSGTHEATNPGNAFFATNDTGSIYFDLGGSYLVDGLAFWNANAPGPGQTGIQGVVISSSEDGVTYTPITGAPSTFAQVMSPVISAEQFSFTAVTASFIRFDVVSNYGDPGNLVAFAEVAFSGVETLGVTNSVLAETISLYPNPASDVIRIKNNSNINLEGITIYDMNGRIVIQHKVTDNSPNQTINISELYSGVYMVQIYSNQASTMKRVIKK